MITQQEISNRFTYHPPKGDQAVRYSSIRIKAGELAALLVDLTPESFEQSLAVAHLDAAVMFANAAIARHE